MVKSISELAGFIASKYVYDAPGQTKFDESDKAAIIEEAKEMSLVELVTGLNGEPSPDLIEHMYTLTTRDISRLIEDVEEYRGLVIPRMMSKSTAGSVVPQLYEYFEKLGENNLFVRRVDYLRSLTGGVEVCDTPESEPVVAELTDLHTIIEHSARLYAYYLNAENCSYDIGSVTITCLNYRQQPERLEELLRWSSGIN